MGNKVLFISHDGNLSGSIVSLSYLITAFQKKGFETIVLLPKKENTVRYLTSFGAQCIHSPIFPRFGFGLNVHFIDSMRLASNEGVRMIFRNILKWGFGLIAVMYAVIKIRPSLLYLNEYVSLQASIIGSFLRIPSVCHIRSRFLIEAYPLRRGILAKLITATNERIFAITEIEAGQFNGLIGHSASDKIMVVPEFLDQRNFLQQIEPSEFKAHHGIPKETIVVLMLGGIDPLKGTLDFLRAAEEVLSRALPAIFIVAGRIVRKGPTHKAYYEQCQKIISRLNMNGSVRLMEEVSDIQNVISLSDIIVSCNTESHFSRPIIEAWSCKKPVIATLSKHSMNLIDDTKNGFLYPSGDAHALAQTLSGLLMDPKQCKVIGDAGYRKARREFGDGKNESTIVNECLQLLEQ